MSSSPFLTRRAQSPERTSRRQRRMIVGLALACGVGAVALPIISKTPSGVSANAPTRSKYSWPFSRYSVWNMPIGSDAQYVPAGIKAPYTERPSFFGGSIGRETNLISTNPSAPIRNLNGSATVKVDPSLSHDGGWNGCAALLSATDGNAVRTGQPLALAPGGNPTWTYDYSQPLTNNPLRAENPYPFDPRLGDTPNQLTTLNGWGRWGCQGGSAMSGIGGTIRTGELAADAPIPHALKLLIYCHLYCHPTGKNGAPFRWPAYSADSYALQPGARFNDNDVYYAGANPDLQIGSLVALPPTFNIASIQHPQVRKIAEALRDYGAYIVDDAAWNSVNIATDTGSEIDDTNPAFIADMVGLLDDLHVVANNSPTSVGGGGVPRACLAPAFDDGTPEQYTNPNGASEPTGCGGSPAATTSAPTTSVATTTIAPAPTTSRVPTTAVASAGPIKIMAIGDSLLSFDPKGAARNELYRLLTTSGTPVDYVGDIRTYWNGTATVEWDTPDPDSMVQGGTCLGADPSTGHLCGFNLREGGLYGMVTGRISYYQPQIVMIMAGINDRFCATPAICGDVPTSYERLIDLVYREQPNATVLFTTGKDFVNVNDFYTEMKPRLETLAINQRAKGRNVAFVDVYPGLTVQDTVDGLHPSTAGHDKMAKAWYDAVVRNYLNRGTTPTTTRPPATSAVPTIRPVTTTTRLSEPTTTPITSPTTKPPTTKPPTTTTTIRSTPSTVAPTSTTPQLSPLPLVVYSSDFSQGTSRWVAYGGTGTILSTANGALLVNPPKAGNSGSAELLLDAADGRSSGRFVVNLPSRVKLTVAANRWTNEWTNAKFDSPVWERELPAGRYEVKVQDISTFGKLQLVLTSSAPMAIESATVEVVTSSAASAAASATITPLDAAPPTSSGAVTTTTRPAIPTTAAPTTTAQTTPAPTSTSVRATTTTPTPSTTPTTSTTRANAVTTVAVTTPPVTTAAVTTTPVTTTSIAVPTTTAAVSTTSTTMRPQPITYRSDFSSGTGGWSPYVVNPVRVSAESGRLVVRRTTAGPGSARVLIATTPRRSTGRLSITVPTGGTVTVSIHRWNSDWSGGQFASPIWEQRLGSRPTVLEIPEMDLQGLLEIVVTSSADFSINEITVS